MTTLTTIPGSTIPGTTIYAWDDRAAFRAAILALDGSGDVSGGRVIETDRDGHMGRLVRSTSSGDPDRAGRTMSFYCWPRRGDSSTPIVLAGAPWATAVDRDEVYWFLASCGCRLNDGTAKEHAEAQAMRMPADIGITAAEARANLRDAGGGQ